LRGDRRAPQRKGISLEFADFRSYVPGDDVRHLDWAGFARLDQLMVKLYHDEEDLQVHILVDESRSMDHGEPSKTQAARTLALALGWIALNRQSRVSVVRLGDERPDALPLQRGPGALERLWAHLEGAAIDGTSPPSLACRSWAQATRPRGAVLVLSDLLDPAGVQGVLRPLLGPTTEVTIIQVLAPTELDPDLEGDLRLVDVESGHRVEVSLTPAIVDNYRRRLRAFLADCAETCRRSGASWVLMSSDEPPERFVLRTLLGEGVVR
jgi:uncharacterized protein (DUF58 family)